MVVEHFLFTVISKVVYKSGERDRIKTRVLASNEFSAMLMAREYLESGKSGYKVKEVIGQYLDVSSSFLADSDVSTVGVGKAFDIKDEATCIEVE